MCLCLTSLEGMISKYRERYKEIDGLKEGLAKR